MLPAVVRRALLDGGLQELPIEAHHALAVAARPPLHRDPFDRLLLAQACAEGLLLITAEGIAYHCLFAALGRGLDWRTGAEPSPDRRVLNPLPPAGPQVPAAAATVAADHHSPAASNGRTYLSDPGRV